MKRIEMTPAELKFLAEEEIAHKKCIFGCKDIFRLAKPEGYYLSGPREKIKDKDGNPDWGKEISFSHAEDCPYAGKRFIPAYSFKEIQYMQQKFRDNFLLNASKKVDKH